MRRRLLITAAPMALLAGAAFAQPGPTGGTIGRQSPLRGPATTGGGPGPGAAGGAPSLDLNFLSGAMPAGVTVSRAAGGATYFDNTGTLQLASANAGRLDYNPVTLTPRGLLIEQARTNSIRNPRAEGAVGGTPGTMPTNWIVANSAGLTSSVIGTGIESGIPYVDLQFSGTSTGTGIVLCNETANSIAASNGQTWTHSLYWRLVGGTNANTTSANVGIYNYTAAPAFIAGVGTNVAFPTTASLASQRASQVATFSDPTTAFARPAFSFNVTNAAAINFTIRIGAPQLELGAFATSPILPAVAAPVATARAADAPTLSALPGLSQSAGSTATEFMLEDINCVAANHDLPSLFTDGSNLLLSRGGAGGVVTAISFNANANVGAISTANVMAVNSIAKHGMSFSRPALVINHTLNAGAIATVAPSSFPAFAGMSLGNVRSGHLDGWLRRVRYWPRALSNAELQFVTA